ncbi:hypothetical protein D3C87_279310 [compost metagenome]
MSDSIKLKVVTHYAEDDPTFYGDYHYIRIYMNDVMLREYGESIGSRTLEGYLDALHDFFGESEVTVTYEKVADQI